MSRRSRTNSRARRKLMLQTLRECCHDQQQQHDKLAGDNAVLSVRVRQLNAQLRAQADLHRRDLEAAHRGSVSARHFQARFASMVNRASIAHDVPPVQRLHLRDAERRGFFQVALSHAFDPCQAIRDEVPNLRIEHEIMQLLRVRAIADQVNRQLHMHVHLAGGQMAYAISDSSLREAPVEELAEHIAAELTAPLAQQIAMRRHRAGREWPDRRDLWERMRVDRAQW